jgi:hypothetical protein
VSRRHCISSVGVLLAAACLASRTGAQATDDDEAQVKAAFVYNFLKFVEWPATAFHGPQGAFVVVIVGDSRTADAAERFLAAKQLGDRPVVVRRAAWDQSLAGAHAVFVAERDGRKLRRVLDAAAAGSVLSIGDADDFTSHGGVIGLVIDNRRVRFDIDTSAARSAGLFISSKLLALTRVVRSTNTPTGARP